MSKRVLLVICSIICITICLFAVACDKLNPPQPDPVSFRQTALYTGGNNNFAIELTGGQSEELFVADGIVGEVHDYVTLCVTPLHVDLFNNEYTYTLTGDKGEVSGALTKDNFGATYTAQVENYASIGTPTQVSVSCKDNKQDITLTDKMQGIIDSNRAMEIAQTTLADKLAADNKDREIYIRFINDSSQQDSPYYWYVAYIAAPTDYYSVLINPASGEVLSVNP